MKPHVVPGSAGEATGTIAPMHVIQAIDLTADAGRRSLWRGRNTATAGVRPDAGLPQNGRASAMGFWLADASESGEVAAECRRITLRAPGGAQGGPEAAEVPQPARPGGRPMQTVRVKGNNSGEGDLFLSIGPNQAQVIASEAAWQTLAEPVLLATCQYWRFCTIDAEIDRLTELAHSDLDHATLPSPASLRACRRLSANAKAVRVLLVDLPHFEGPLTDPLAYCTTERAAQAFETLAEKLHLEQWCEAIDERAEAIEDTYEAVTEKLFEYRNFAWEAFLEAIIVVILLGELAVMIWEIMTP